MKKYIAILLLLTMTTLQVKAIGPYTDPIRVAALLATSASAKKALDAEMAAQALNTTGHIWFASEVKETTNFQREFCEYLDTLEDVLTLTAEVYGIYYEISRTVKNINDLEKTVSRSPANVFAVAFSSRRNGVYRRLIENGVDIVMDIKHLFDKKAKHTEVDRIKLFTGIRPRLHALNKTLTILNLSIKYTDFADVWREITDRQHSYLTSKTKKEIAARCIKNWKYNARLR